jgi:hypothetical protein
MTEQLKQAFERAQQLSDDAQNVLATQILEAIEEDEWDEIIRKPHVQNKLLALAEEGWREYEKGRNSFFILF